MSRVQWGVVLLFLAVVAAAATMPGRVGAYGGPCHGYITDQAASIFPFPELNDFLPSVSDGAFHEDDVDHVWDNDFVTMNHFWDADAGDFSTQWWGAYEYHNAWVKARTLLDWALARYHLYINSGSFDDQLWAYHYLGHAAHLLGDMGVPGHVHLDYHWPDDDCYEDWMEGDTPEPAGCGRWNHEHAVGKYGGVLDLPDPLLDGIIAYLGGECWPPQRLHASLYYLMYTANQVSDRFASDSYDGDDYDRHGWVDYTGFPGRPYLSDQLDNNDDDPDNDNDGDLTRIAERAYLYAMCGTATLYKAWRDYLDHVPPNTQLHIFGAAVFQDGWRPGGVEMLLTADDYSAGTAVHDSGVHEIQWKTSHPDWQTYTEPIDITAEGITDFHYRSMDRFGNLEEANLETIKIDMTPPVVSIISPTPDGLYLTSETLTIDYEASDVPSGLYSVEADLDGDPVSDGQVFDLDAMAGWHTVTVTAVDMAGNTTTESVYFSIKIHATVDIKPDLLNTKSGGGVLTAYIEFPPLYDVSLINVSTVELTVNSTSVLAGPWPAIVGFYDPEGIPELMVQFARRPVCTALAGINADVTMIVSGELIPEDPPKPDEVEFYGTDIVAVFSPGK